MRQDTPALEGGDPAVHSIINTAMIKRDEWSMLDTQVVGRDTELAKRPLANQWFKTNITVGTKVVGRKAVRSWYPITKEFTIIDVRNGQRLVAMYIVTNKNMATVWTTNGHLHLPLYGSWQCVHTLEKWNNDDPCNINGRER